MANKYLNFDGLSHLIDKLKASIAKKVDKVEGKSLSTNDYTTAEKTKLAGIAEGANNYTLPSAGTSLGGVKSGGDVTISGGVITVNDDSHNHKIENVDGLQSALDGKSDEGHTHSYAGSSTAGGSANSAVKLDSSAGSATQPVYFSNGKPVKTTYTLEKSVPSDAKFTDTVYTHPTHTEKVNGLYKVTVDDKGHVSETAAVTKSDITALGIPAQDTVYTLPSAGTSLGGVKSGGDVTISDGVITVKDDSHNHTIANVDGLQTALDGKETAGAAATALTNANSHTDEEIETVTELLEEGLATKANARDLTSHVNDKSNPHGVTLSQLGVTATAAELNKMDGVTATTAELNYVDGVTSNIQTQLNAKAASSSLTSHTGNKSNPHGVTAAQVGLGNVNNTADADKPVSTAQSSAISTAKEEAVASANDYTDGKIADLINSAPSTLDTLGEIATAMEENADVVEALNEAIGTKANVSDIPDVINNLTSTATTDALSAYQGKVLNDKISTINTSLASKGSGDMLKSVYDTDGDGIVDNAEKVNGFTVGVNVPANAKFTDTVYTHPTYTAKSSGLYKVTVDGKGHVSGTAAVAKSDITALGIPAQDTTYSVATTSANGLMSSTDKKKVDAVSSYYQLGSMSGKTKADLQTALDTWLNSYCDIPNATAIFSGAEDWATAWNSSDTTKTISAGGQWTVSIIARYNSKAYTQLRIAYYSDERVYYVVRSNSTWQTAHQAAFKDDLPSEATTSKAGLLSSTDKTKLNGIATGAEVNQNAFSNITVGSTTIAADAKTDTLTLAAGSNVTITPDATNDKITIAATDTKYSQATSSTAGLVKIGYTESGKNYPVELNSSGQMYVNVPWTDNNTTYSVATTSANGLMSSTDKSKLDGIASGANKYTHPTYTARTGKPTANATPAFGGTFTVSQITSDGTGHVTGATDRTITIPSTAATTSAAGLMSASDKSKLDGITASADSVAFSASATSGNKVGTITINGTATNMYSPTQTSVSGNAGTATKLATARTIALSDGATGTATSFDGSANISIPVTAVKESYLSWGGKSTSGSVTPVGAALSAEHSANRLAYLNPAALAFEYSDNGGSSWTALSVSDTTKVGHVTTSGTISVGSASTVTTNHRTRMTLTAQNGTTGYVYTRPRKLLINVSTAGHGLSVTIEYKTGASGASWKTLGTYALSGWSGWNDIDLSGLSTLGGSTTQTGNNWYFRFTYATTSINSSYTTTKSTIIGMRLFGDTCWTRTSNMGETGHLYSYDTAQNATFPAKVTATSFAGKLTGFTASRALVSDSSGNATVSAVTSTELGYLDGVTSNVQTQINALITRIAALEAQIGFSTNESDM